MAVEQRSDTYWSERADARVDLAEQELPKHRRKIFAVYASAEKETITEIKKLYKAYYSSKGVDLEALTSKLSFLETRRFWIRLRKRGMRSYVASNYRYRITRLELALGEIYMKIHDLIDAKELAEHTQLHVKTYNTTFNRSVYDLAVATNSNVAFSGVNHNLLNTVLQRQWLGSNYSARIWSNTDILANTLTTLIGKAVLRGQPITKTATILRKRFGVARSYADRLVRTETNFIYSEAEHESHKQLDVKKYKYVATLDNRTSKICQRLDGKVFLVSKRKVGTNCNPMHSNCRSATRPYLSKTYEPKLRRARDSRGQNILVENMNYNQWSKIHNVQNVAPTITPTIQAR